MKTLERTRTVRLSADIDQRIEAQAAKHGRTASELIRETLEAEFAAPRQTAGQWILKAAKLAADRPADRTFSAAYRRRHQET